MFWKKLWRDIKRGIKSFFRMLRHPAMLIWVIFSLIGVGRFIKEGFIDAPHSARIQMIEFFLSTGLLFILWVLWIYWLVREGDNFMTKVHYWRIRKRKKWKKKQLEKKLQKKQK